MLEIKNVTYSYKKRPVLCDINLEVREGESIHIMGNSGSGKSTLIRTLNGLIPQFYGGTFKGLVNVNQKNTLKYKIKDLAKEVGILFQDPENQFLTSTVESEIAFGMENIGIKPSDMKTRVEYLAEKLFLTHLLDKKTSELSGGEKQKVILASILAMDPNILAFDEPHSEIDHQSSQSLNELLRNLKQEKTILIAEHRHYPDCDRSVYLKHGTITHHDKEEYKNPKLSSDRGSLLLDVSDLSAGYNGSCVISDINLDISEGDCVTLTGRNGCGKSTVIKAILGFIKIHSGNVTFEKTQKKRDIFKKVGIVFQNTDTNFLTDSVYKELEDSIKHTDIKDKDKVIEEALKYFELNKKAFPRELSGGEQERLALATVFIRKPDIVFLDEPTRGMDQKYKQKLFELLNDHCTQGGAALIATHDTDIISFSNREIKMEDAICT